MKAGIIDDSRLARKELSMLLEVYKSVEVIWEAENVDDAVRKINGNQTDVIFLDIHMPGKNGFNLLEELECVPQVIFTTAYDEYALKAFEYNALDYLLKPIATPRLEQALEKVMNVLEEKKVEAEKADVLTENDQVFVKDGEDCWFVKLKEIRLFEIEGNYSRIWFGENRSMIPKTLNYLETRLDPKVFFRANRQQLINLKYIDKVIPWFSGTLKITLKGGGEEVELSRRQSTRFKEVLSF